MNDLIARLIRPIVYARKRQRRCWLWHTCGPWEFMGWVKHSGGIPTGRYRQIRTCKQCGFTHVKDFSP